LATPEKIKAIAKDLAKLYEQQKKILIVVSAMGETTNELLKKAQSITDNPNTRELDMLLSSGERVSGALLAMALLDLGVPARSFTGSQAGILTCGNHNDASIKAIRPYRLEESLNNKVITILAGFQGVNPDTKDVTTLGRGGSDTTAVALANYFNAPYLELIKEVDGVYDKDPNANEDAHHFKTLSHDKLIELTKDGAKVVHHKAAELAKKLKVELHIGNKNKTIVK